MNYTSQQRSNSSYILQSHHCSEPLAAVLAIILEAARRARRAGADLALHMIIMGRLGSKPAKTEITVEWQGRCRYRCGRGGDILLLWNLGVGVAGGALLVLLLLLLRLLRWSKVSVIIDIAGLVSQPLGSSEGVDEPLSLDGLKAPLEGLVQQTVAGLGENTVRELVQVGGRQVIDNFVLSSANHGHAKVAYAALNRGWCCMMNACVELQGIVREKGTAEQTYGTGLTIKAWWKSEPSRHFSQLSRTERLAASGRAWRIL